MLADKSCREFIEVLASDEPTPGGGGASALVGAVGTALGNMVGSLTEGKLQYYEVEEDMERLIDRSEELEKEFLELIEEDEKAFQNLMTAYKMPHTSELEKAKRLAVLTAAKSAACQPPLRIMKRCCEAIDLCAEFAEKGNRNALSDAGVGVLFCKAALQGASLNIYINTKTLADEEYAGKLNDEADRMISEYSAKADSVYEKVLSSLR
ncbi:MAG: cyclodeaminase/cyclohydrolase family protein [Eubacterium sp.]|nr:cyclodeaminase/cyclohydrolase family protein [Eubacterium sp.]